MKIIKRGIAIILILLMACSVGGTVVSAENTVTSFSDVLKTYWGYDTIMRMTEWGLFKGMTEPINGVSEFWPERTMSRAEFITVSVRAMYPDEAKTIKNQAGDWWKGYYELALEKRILFSNELDSGALNLPMSRQEMAMVMVRCVENNEEGVTESVSVDQIADYASIPSFYKLYVRKCFSLGLICGIDDIGTFAPSMSLTRSQAATVLCRLVDKDSRVDVNAMESIGHIKDDSVELPWENGGKQPKDYTWEEYEALNPVQQMEFQNTFENYVIFEDWMQKAKAGYIPWENGGKQPEDYTWAEFETLTPEQQVVFQNSFGSMAAFDAWMQKVQSGSGDLPWENGGKQPRDYTWVEFEALTPAQQIAFQNSFGSDIAFEAWMEKAQFGNESNPWENGGKQPKDYTWAEFEALTPAQQMAFQYSFGSIEEFDKWLTKNQP